MNFLVGVVRSGLCHLLLQSRLSKLKDFLCNERKLVCNRLCVKLPQPILPLTLHSVLVKFFNKIKSSKDESFFPTNYDAKNYLPQSRPSKEIKMCQNVTKVGKMGGTFNFFDGHMGFSAILNCP